MNFTLQVRIGVLFSRKSNICEVLKHLNIFVCRLAWLGCFKSSENKYSSTSRALKKVSVSRTERLYYEGVRWQMIDCVPLVLLSRSAKGYLINVSKAALISHQSCQTVNKVKLSLECVAVGVLHGLQTSIWEMKIRYTWHLQISHISCNFVSVSVEILLK